MTTDLFQRQPWLNHAQPPYAKVAGMLGPYEAWLYFHLAAEAFTGRGTIVDAGSFLGRSAVCFAEGLRQNPRFDAARDRIYCIDNFMAQDPMAIDFIRDQLGLQLKLGDSFREVFDRQTVTVSELLDVHEGNFLLMSWQSRPIEILMVDIAKTIGLWSKVIELFFRDLIPGVSLVVHQDYHHPRVPHIVVVMEYLAEFFENLVSRVDGSSVFRLSKAIPDEMLKQAVAYDFSLEEQLELLQSARRRLPDADSHHLELSRIYLLARTGDMGRMRQAFDEVAAQHFDQVDGQAAAREQTDAARWQRQLRLVQDFVDEAEADHCIRHRDFQRALTRATALAERQQDSLRGAELQVQALVGLDRLDEAESVLAQARQRPASDDTGNWHIAGMQITLGHYLEAQQLLLDSGAGSLFPQGPRRGGDLLCAVWEHHRDPENEEQVVTRLREEMPGEPEVEVLAARALMMRGDRAAAQQALMRAMELGLHEQRCDELLRPLGLSVKDL